MITNAAITIFNGRTDKGERRIKYFPTVIGGVSYQEAKGSVIGSNGVWGENVNYKIRIPLVGSDVQGKRLYLPCLKYAKLEEIKATAYWTIKKGDLIVRGEDVGGAFPLYEDELTAYAKEQGLDLIHVAEYADNTLGGSLYTRHWRIGGK